MFPSGLNINILPAPAEFNCRINIMKRALLSILVLATVFAFSIGSFSIVGADEGHENRLPSAQNNGAYVEIKAIPDSGGIKFDYGWNDSRRFANPAVGYWLGLYDDTALSYVWAGENRLTTAPAGSPGTGTIVWNSLKLSYQDTAPLICGHKYKICFFVRGNYNTYTNVAAIECPFSTQWISVVNPKWESCRVGTSQSITWTSRCVTGNVNILLSRDGGATFPETITSVPVDVITGTPYTWIVSGPATKKAVIKVVSVSDPAIFDTSKKFTIK